MKRLRRAPSGSETKEFLLYSHILREGSGCTKLECRKQAYSVVTNFKLVDDDGMIFRVGSETVSSFQFPASSLLRREGDWGVHFVTKRQVEV